jgi:hypothetical protein
MYLFFCLFHARKIGKTEGTSEMPGSFRKTVTVYDNAENASVAVNGNGRSKLTYYANE